jgi:hypothetical protein
MNGADATIAGLAERQADKLSIVWNEEQAKQVELLWSKVFEDSNRVLKQHQYYGFDGVKAMPNPDVPLMVMNLKILSGMMDVLLNTDAPYDQTRQILNAKKQITSMEQLALALLAENQEDYNQALEALRNQAAF